VKIKYTPKAVEPEESTNTPADDEAATDPAPDDASASGQDGDDDL
jgi:hypothetical protein